MRSCWSTFHVTFIHLTANTTSFNVGLKCPEPRKEQSGQEEATTINEEADDYYSVVKYLIAKGGRSAGLESLAVCRILHVLIVTQGIQAIMLEFGLETFSFSLVKFR